MCRTNPQYSHDRYVLIFFLSRLLRSPEESKAPFFPGLTSRVTFDATQNVSLFSSPAVFIFFFFYKHPHDLPLEKVSRRNSRAPPRVIRGQRAARIICLLRNFADRRVRRRDQTYRLIKQPRIRPVPAAIAAKEIARALCDFSRYSER